MYLLPVNTRQPKRRLSLLLGGPRVSGYGLTLGMQPRSIRARRGRRTGALGSLGDGGNCVYYSADGATVESTDANSSSVECASTGGSWFPSGKPAPVVAPPQASQPIVQAYKNVLTAASNSANPLDYTSPQAAKAVGLDPATVDATWAKALSRFPTQQAAVDAGINAGVVNSLWAYSRQFLGGAAGGGDVFGWLSKNWTVPAVIVGGLLAIRAAGR